MHALKRECPTAQRGLDTVAEKEARPEQDGLLHNAGFVSASIQTYSCARTPQMLVINADTMLGTATPSQQPPRQLQPDKANQCDVLDIIIIIIITTVLRLSRANVSVVQYSIFRDEHRQPCLY